MAGILPAGFPSGIFPGINLFGQNISSVGLVNPVQAGFTAIQALASAPLTAVNALASSINTALTGGINAVNTILLGVLGAPFGTASGVNLGGIFAFPFPFFGLSPSGLLGFSF
jgi:hypothetical protein